MRVLEKLGFEKEGVLRDNAFARERYWDHCLYARVGGSGKLKSGGEPVAAS